MGNKVAGTKRVQKVAKIEENGQAVGALPVTNIFMPDFRHAHLLQHGI